MDDDKIPKQAISWEISAASRGPSLHLKLTEHILHTDDHRNQVTKHTARKIMDEKKTMG